jgi:hypothetical protein
VIHSSENWRRVSFVRVGARAAFTALAVRAILRRMDLPAFRASLAAPAPPAGLSLALQALWLDGKGDWDGAHELAQRGEGGAGDWVHAYLHRKEGDNGNAAYWYRRAGNAIARGPLDDEWAAIVTALL